MATFRTGGDDSLFNSDFLPGGSATVPATARTTTPAAIAPTLFPGDQTTVADPGAARTLPGGSPFTFQTNPTPGAPAPGAPGSIASIWPSNAGPAPAGYTVDQATGNAYTYNTPPAAASTTYDPNNPLGWITSQLQLADSTDDPNYWASHIASDPNVQNPATRDSALAYWAGRIAQGDGAAAVKNGTVQKFQDAPASSNDPNNDAINAALASLLGQGGMTPQGQQVFDQLMGIVKEGGVTPDTTAAVVQARDNNATAFRGQVADAHAQLAANGMADEPGVAQGAGASAVQRITDSLAPTYASALTDVSNHAQDVKNQSLLSALSMATGMSTSGASNLLGAANSSTQRTATIANIALQQLSLDQGWNEFVANYGLSKDQLSAMISQGNWGQVLSLIQAYENASGTSAGGHI